MPPHTYNNKRHVSQHLQSAPRCESDRALPLRIVISIVTYRSDQRPFLDTLRTASRALSHSRRIYSNLECDLFVIENDHGRHANLDQANSYFLENGDCGFNKVIIKSLGTNLGYGRGHNAALSEAEPADYYLVLNPDVRLAEDAITTGLSYMQAHPSVALLSPAAVDGDGVRLHLCKQFPCVLDLLLRGFAPNWVREQFKRRLGLYEMHELANSDIPVLDIPIVSGCCMLLRRRIYANIGGFDRKYFLYFEDFDLSLRAGRIADCAYLPSMKIVHLGGNAAKKGLRHIFLFAASGIKFYRQHGWRWL